MNDEWKDWLEQAEKDGVDVSEVIEGARYIHRKLIYVSTMDRLAAVTFGFVVGLVVGCLLT